jgi:hypothetical protein
VSESLTDYAARLGITIPCPDCVEATVAYENLEAKCEERRGLRPVEMRELARLRALVSAGCGSHW